MLGVAYKRDIDDVRESPALDMIVELLQRKARVSYHDPYVAQVAMDGHQPESQPLTPETLRRGRLCGDTTDTPAWIGHGAAHARVVVDTRNALRGQRRHGSVRTCGQAVAVVG